MQSLSRGWSFLQQAWNMALKDRDIIKPSIYAMIVGLVISIVGIIPLIGAAFLLGNNGVFGRGVMIVIGAGLVFAHYVVRYDLFRLDCVFDLWLSGRGRWPHG